jgi:hypothetical protein
VKFAGIDEFVAAYQARATGRGVDRLGFYVPPFADAAMQILGQAVEKTGSLDQGALAASLHANTSRPSSATWRSPPMANGGSRASSWFRTAAFPATALNSSASRPLTSSFIRRNSKTAT